MKSSTHSLLQMRSTGAMSRAARRRVLTVALLAAVLVAPAAWAQRPVMMSRAAPTTSTSKAQKNVGLTVLNPTFNVQLANTAGAAGTVQGKLDMSQYETTKRKSIKYKPLDMVNPATGKPVSANTMLTLRGNRKIKASQLYAELNRVEKYLNSIGYSLRGSQKKFVVGQPKAAFTARIAQQARSQSPRGQVLLALPAGSKVSARNFDRARTQLASATAGNVKSSALRPQLQLGAKDMVATLDLGPRQHTAGKSWNKELGDPDIVSAYFKGNFQFKATRDQVSGHAEASAGAAIAGFSQDLVRGTADVSARSNGAASVSLSVERLGISVFNFSQEGNIDKAKTQKVRLFSPSIKFPIPLGPISITLAAGVSGDAEYEMQVISNSQPSSGRHQVTLKFRPSVKAVAFVQVGVGVSVFEAGVRGNLTLVSAYGSIFGHMTLNVGDNKATVSELMTADYGVELLSGSVEVFAGAYAGPVTIAELSTVVWDFSGFKFYEELMNSLKTTTL